MKHLNITVMGYVQGVGFRYYIYRNAVRIGTTGYVKNLFNGNVFIECEGNEAQLEEFIGIAKCGPISSDVTNIDIEKGELQHFKEFNIR